MAAKILDGRAIAQKIYEELKRKITGLKVKPKLSVVLVGNDPESLVYVNQKHKIANELGVSFELIKAPESFPQTQLEKLINKLNKDKSVNGIVVQKPLPAQIDSDKVDVLVYPEKDVDGLNPISPFMPATVIAVFELLNSENIKVRGKDAVVVGKSTLTGLPTALEFLDRGATVTICHESTRNLAEKTKLADILAVATGKPGLITADMVKDQAVVIDIGISRIVGADGKARLVGDVDFEAVSKKASYISPVPGGVGAVTVAGVMVNLVKAAGSSLQNG
jgi:methylenetetrahydrofolate dehydrogenase (NADP+)/methenyltetrahydrofolate cyclohydrolase